MGLEKGKIGNHMVMGMEKILRTKMSIARFVARRIDRIQSI